jgi:hypothetical protein
MQTRLVAIVALALLLASARAEAQFRPAPDVVPPEDFHVELGLMFWQPDPELTLTTGNNLIGTVDFVQEFGIADERFREFRAVLRPARKHKIRFAYVPLKYDQDAVLQRTITFQNLRFPATANANADISWDVYRIGYEWDFVALPRGFVGVIGEVKYNKVNATVSASGNVFGQPINVEFTGFKFDRDEFGGKFYDFDIYGAAHLGKYVGVQVGYRSMDVDFQTDEEDGVMTMKGPYFGGFLRF